MSGANDERRNTPLGSVAAKGSQFDTTTYIGSLQSGIEYALAGNPDLEIVLFTPIVGWIYADGAGDEGYQYDYDKERSIITIFSSLTRSYQIMEENGKPVIATIENEISFVRKENYEEFRSVCVKQFYDKGREGREELTYGQSYVIQDGIHMTVNGCIQGEVADMAGNFPLFLQITLENVSEKGIYVRHPGGVVDGVIKPMFSEITVSVDAQYFNSFGSLGFDSLLIAKRTNETMTDSDFKLYLEPGVKEEYYLKLSGIYLQAVEQEPTYVVITFDNIEMFFAISAVLAGE
jgi:hypothetical protein